jgi:hypothetical protein
VRDSDLFYRHRTSFAKTLGFIIQGTGQVLRVNSIKIRFLRLRRIVGEMFHVEGSVLVIGLTASVIALLLLRVAIFLVSGW